MADVQSKGTPSAVDLYVGRRIRQRRKERGMTLIQLGELAGVTYQQMQKYEMGQNRVAPSRLVAIASALQTPLSVFFPMERADETTAGQSNVHPNCLAAARLASEVATVLLAADLSVKDGVVHEALDRLVDAVRLLAEIEPRPDDSELLVGIYRWKATAS